MATSKISGVLKASAVSDGLKWWLVASVLVLLGSLVLFVANVVAGFVYFNQEATPLWVTVLGVFAILGMVLGFGGLFLVLILAVIRERRGKQAQLPAEQGTGLP